MTHISIYHNPRCSKSRQTLAILQDNGIEPHIIKYLETPPSEDELKNIISLLNVSPRELMRKNEQAYKDNNMASTDLSNEDLIKLMCQFPKVIERPIVVNDQKAVIGRPPENVLDII